MRYFIPFLFLLLTTVPHYSQTMNCASSTTGIAPFAVYFDAVGDSSGVVQPELINDHREYADLYYSWDFGDPGSRVWHYSQRSKNHDIGFNTCHVYDEPGTYIVTLQITDLSGSSYSYTQTIEVLDPDKIFAGPKTICISSTGNFDEAPEGAQLINTSNILEIEPYLATGNRILLCRGDSWSANEGMHVNGVPGPVFIGAYGEGLDKDEYGIYRNAPLIYLNGDDEDGSFISYWNVSNWTICDLHFVGNKSYHGAIGGGIGECRNMLHYRMHFEGFNTPVGNTHWETDGNDRWMLISSKVHDTRGIVVYAGSERLVVMGNLLYNSDETHVLRVWQAYKGVISHNYSHGSSLHSTSGRHALKFHGPSEETLARTDESRLKNRTQYAVVYDNIFGTCGPWTVVVAPQDDASDERLSDILIEGNRFLSGYGTFSELSNPVFLSLRIQGDYITARNNVFDGTGSGRYWGAVDIFGTDFKNSNNNRFINNTIVKFDYDTDDESYITFTGIKLSDGAENSLVRNNLIHLTSDNLDVEELYNDEGNNSTIDHNLLTKENCFHDPYAENILYHDFRLIEDCEAIDAGTQVSIFHDFDLISRPNGSLIDIGAFELSDFVPQYPDTSDARIDGEIILYPNPFHENPTILYYSEDSYIATFVVCNLLGQQVASLRGNIYEGENRIELDLPPLQKGVYYILFKNRSGKYEKLAGIKL